MCPLVLSIITIKCGFNQICICWNNYFFYSLKMHVNFVVDLSNVFNCTMKCSQWIVSVEYSECFIFVDRMYRWSLSVPWQVLLKLSWREFCGRGSCILPRSSLEGNCWNLHAKPHCQRAIVRLSPMSLFVSSVQERWSECMRNLLARCGT